MYNVMYVYYVFATVTRFQFGIKVPMATAG